MFDYFRWWSSTAEKVRWGVYDKSQCKLRFYKSDFEEDIVDEIDVLSGTFTYDLENDQNGQFKIW